MNAESVSEIKDKGNKAFKQQNYPLAIKKFTEALTIDPANTACYSNRAAAYTKMGAKDANYLPMALEDAEKCIELDATFVKGYHRKGGVLMLQKQYKAALDAYMSGLKHEPKNKNLLSGKKGAEAGLKKLYNEMSATEHVIGIDLGTTNSCVGVWLDGAVKIIPNEQGNMTTPSYVAFDPKTGKRSVGFAAKKLAPRYPENTIYDIKRVIGQRFTDEGVDIDCKSYAFKVAPDDDDKPVVEVDLGMHGTKKFAPEQISALVLQNLKRSAEKYLKTTVKKAVITVPAYFNDAQRNATKAAGLIAGLEVMRIINEPTAAALSYGLDSEEQAASQKILVFDLGGGTFDVSMLTINEGVFEVTATGGDTRLGGEDFDHSVVEWLKAEATKQGIEELDSRALKLMRNAAEKAKRALSSGISTDIVVDAIGKTDLKKGKDFKTVLTRKQFELLNRGHFLRTMDTVKRVMKDGNANVEDIDQVVLVGGSTRIPKIQELLSDYFEGKTLCKQLNPDEAVAYGAAVQGAILNGKRTNLKDLLLVDVTPLSLGIETTGRVMSVIIPRNTSIPVVKTQTYTTESNYQTSIDVCVYEGERARTDKNNMLGKFTISGIEKAKRGEPKIDVSFSLDSNGILSVQAKDQTTGAEARIEIENRSRSSNSDIERMIAEADKFRREDEQRMRKVDSVNSLETLISEVMEIAATQEDALMGEQLSAEANAMQEWLDEHHESAKASDVNAKKRELERTLSKTTNRRGR